LEEHLSVNPVNHSRRGEFWAGVKATFPLVVGAIPFGIIFGALSVTSGLSPAATQAMSTFVFAGSAQFIAAGLVASGTGNLVIILTTLVVNLRHMLYAATLAPRLKDLPQRWLLPLGFWLTDETFVVTAQRYDRPDDSPNKHWFFLGSEVFMYTNWQLCTFIGLKAGQAIHDAASWGLDFAMVVTFIGMLVPVVKNRPAAASVLVAGITALLANSLPHKLGLILAAVLGILAGVLAEQVWPVPNPEKGAA
jgi:4-azaleucine resistance transporter AzlC